MKKTLTNLLLVLMFAMGLGVALYPTISNQFNLYRASLLINQYESEVFKLDPADYTEHMAACDAYNEGLIGGTVPDVFSIHSDEASPEYMSLLNLQNDGLMGSVEIPRIGVKVPILHTTFDSVLQRGAGHMEGSSLPVGGRSTHAVLAAHRGLPSAKLFSDLDQVEIGDLIIINVLGEALTYTVDQILVVVPQETQHLAIVPGRDLVTLVTCTPYAINTHRLLVRGSRVYPGQVVAHTQIVPDAEAFPRWKSTLFVAVPTFAVGYLLLGIGKKWKQARK